jgi:hypothetical protein
MENLTAANIKIAINVLTSQRTRIRERILLLRTEECDYSSESEALRKTTEIRNDLVSLLMDLRNGKTL